MFSHSSARALARTAFTLIELLVVVAVISILIAILTPGLSQAREQGKAVSCSSNMRQLMLAVQMYSDANNGFFPQVGLTHSGAGNDLERSWVAQLAGDYGRQQDILRCPSDRSSHWTQPLTIAGSDPIFRQTSYADTYYLVADISGSGLIHHRYDRIRWPATTVFFVELAEAGQYAGADHVHPEYWHPPSNPKARAAEEIEPDQHTRKANYAMVDGHVERVQFEKTLTKGPDYRIFQPTFLYNKYDPDIAR